MTFARFVVTPVLALALTSCKPLAPEVISQDCTIAAVPAGFTRIFIGTPAPGGQQSGTSAQDPLDGTSAEKFDTILRTIAEGQRPAWGTQKNIPQENLIVCIADGTFQTEGQYDWDLDKGRTRGTERGFTVEKNWKIHGRGPGRTRLQMVSYLPTQFVDDAGTSFAGGYNTVISTRSDTSFGVELSDLTVDANHDQLSGPGRLPLNVMGILLRSRLGGHWIHDVNVVGASADAGFRNINYENFAVRIWGNTPRQAAEVSTGNLIENVNVSGPGLPTSSGSPPGGCMDAIVVNNLTAEIRNNVVEGYFIAYSGWTMDQSWFHDNIARNSVYGFNADSFSNHGVTLQANQFIHPVRYAMVIGGADSGQAFSHWNVLNNLVQLNTSGSAGIILQGQVQNSAFSGNTIQSDGGAPHNVVAILSFDTENGVANVDNSFQENRIDKAFTIDFSRDPHFNTNCRFLNRDLQGNPRQDFPDNSSATCR